MKNKYFLVLITTVLISCSSDNVAKNENGLCKLKNVDIVTLTFDDIAISGFNESFSNKLYFEYDNQNRISKVKGSVVNIPGGNQLNSWMFSNDAFDLVTYENNVIKVQYSYNYQSPFTKEFTIENGKLMNRKVSNLYPNKTEPILYNYEYAGNEINEIVNGKIFRKFTLSNGNLVKVEQINYSFLNNEIVGKKEYVFSGYDTSKNLLKDAFFVNGAFFKAFSANNYTAVKINLYEYKNNSFSLIDESGSSFQLQYNSDNIASIFSRECE